MQHTIAGAGFGLVWEKLTKAAAEQRDDAFFDGAVDKLAFYLVFDQHVQRFDASDLANWQQQHNEITAKQARDAWEKMNG